MTRFRHCSADFRPLVQKMTEAFPIVLGTFVGEALDHGVLAFAVDDREPAFC